MANISKITALDGTTYNIKDALSREAIADLQYVVGAIGSGAFEYKGSAASYSNLPENASLGDMYTVADEGNSEYVWDGDEWVKLNSLSITNLQIDALFI